MRKFVLSLALAGGLAAFGGCQQHDNHRVATDDRPMRGDFTHAYTATEDTSWRASTSADAERGTVRRGTVVYTDRPMDMSRDWQQARFSDGSVRYVDPDDFRASGTASVHD
jgi:hypothetical protein